MNTIYNFCRSKSPLLGANTNSDIVKKNLTYASIWMIGGRFYNCKDNPEEKEMFIQAFENLLWFSYRSQFEPIPGTNCTSDAGWGCMLRVGQMILAEALQRAGSTDILKLFVDHSLAPFSIHSITQAGALHGKARCDWYGPVSIAQTLKKLVEFHDSCKLAMYINSEGILFRNELIRMVSHGIPFIILLPVRLGLGEINPLYFDYLSYLFQCKYHLGIIGGKPRSSLYFVASQDQYLFYLDPHFLQPALQVDATDMEKVFVDDSSYRNCPMKKMLMSDLDPSLAVGFMITSRKDLFELFVFIDQMSTLFEHSLFQVSSDNPPPNISAADADADNNKIILLSDDELNELL